ncbi:MAG: pyridoxine 5'-phosphate oxidase C-terminal domain-containing protein [Bacteroidales bacterium]
MGRIYSKTNCYRILARSPSRLHNRLKYVKDNGEWRVEILAP